MDNFYLVTFAYWPAVVVIAALLNMLTSWTFSWSELVMDYLAGVLVGALFMLGTAEGSGHVAEFFLMMSQGIYGLLHWVGVEALQDRATLFYWSAGSVLVATTLAGLLDRATLAIGKSMNVGGGFLSIVIFALKAPFALLTTGVSLLIWLVGLFYSFASRNARVGFLGGVFYAEWNTSVSADWATTLGAGIQVWRSTMAKVIEHELYHTRQYIYLHDWFIPAWLVGGLWGLISSAIDKNFRWCFFIAARHDKEVGNPIERAAFRIDGSSTC